MRKICVLILCTTLFFNSFGQNSSPDWLQATERNMRYSLSEYFTGYAEKKIQLNEDIEDAVKRIKSEAEGLLIENVYVNVKSVTVYNNSSYKINDVELLESQLNSTVQTKTSMDIIGLKTVTHIDKKNAIVYAFSYVRKSDLSNFYKKQVEVNLMKCENFIELAFEQLNNKENRKARKQLDETVDLLNIVSYHQNLLTAIDAENNEPFLQLIRSSNIHHKVTRVLSELESSISIAISCQENIQGKNVSIIFDMLPGLLTDKGCGCNFVENKNKADYVINISSSISRSSKSNGLSFCWAKSILSIKNNNTQITVKPKIEETKGGYTDYNTAAQKAFEKLAVNIAEQIIKNIK